MMAASLWFFWSFLFSSRTTTTNTDYNNFDLVIIGAGASGLFACGAASSLGMNKIALIETSRYVGGDCTNSACVPSKALRSIVRVVVIKKNEGKAREHVKETVQAVRRREAVSDMEARNPGVTVMINTTCTFTGPHELLVCHDDNNNRTITSRRFLITTGASPVVPDHLRLQAAAARVHLSTYRTFLTPKDNECDVDPIWKEDTRVLIVGGGPTACELGQSLARLRGESTTNARIELVAPSILPCYDVKMRNAGLQILQKTGIRIHQGYVQEILPDKRVRLRDGTVLPNSFDVILLCMGREPSSLESLCLDSAGVQWDPKTGVSVTDTLQSTTAPHVYAAGDCANLVRPKTSALAAWTGFHAVRNMVVPFVLRVGSQSIHPVVPRVIYTDPELACVGADYVECVRKLGKDGFQSLCVFEEGSDRADMERCERDTSLSFIELRADRNGRVLGCTCCGPAASELANGVGMAITNRMTVRDIARSVHSYPSHGYLLYRVALAMSLSSVWGLVDACGPFGGILATFGRTLQSAASGSRHLFRRILPSLRRKEKARREWELVGAGSILYLGENASLDEATDRYEMVSFLDVLGNETLLELVNETMVAETLSQHEQGPSFWPMTHVRSFSSWRRAEPAP